MKKNIVSLLILAIFLMVFTMMPINVYAALNFDGTTLKNTVGDTLYGLQSYGGDLYWFDETTGIARTNSTIIFSHIIFETGSDGKITRKSVENPFTGEIMDTFGVPEEGYENDPRVIVFLWGLSQNGKAYKLYSDGVNNYSCGHFTQKAFNAIGYICTRSSSFYQAVSSRRPDTMTSGGYAISSLKKDGQLVTPKLIFSSDETEGTPSLDEVKLRVGDIIFYEYINGGAGEFREGAKPGTAFPNGPYYDYMHAPENQELYDDVKYIHHVSFYVGQGKIMESGLNYDYNGVHVCNLRESSDMNNLRVKYIYRYINDDAENEKAATFDDQAVQKAKAVPDGRDGVKVSWKPVVGAEGYLVYGASADGASESLIGTVVGGTVTSFIDENVSEIYYVYAYTTILDSNQKKLNPVSDPAPFRKVLKSLNEQFGDESDPD